MWQLLQQSKSMDSEIDFYQIYYREDQLGELYTFAKPYYNNHLTKFFENSVIAELVPQSTAKRICVASWRLKQKRGGLIRVKKQLLINDLIDDYDVAILTPRSPTHKPMVMARQWHGIAWDNAITELKKFIKVPKELKYTIYENHFVASADLYKSYVDDCLIPCMQFMSSNDVFNAPSGYKKRKSKEDLIFVQNQTGFDDWTIAPFILERLFSIWINDKNLKVVNK